MWIKGSCYNINSMNKPYKYCLQTLVARQGIDLFTFGIARRLVSPLNLASQRLVFFSQFSSILKG